MKKRNVLLLVLSLGGIIGAAGVATTHLYGNSQTIGTNADDVTYSFVFDKDSNLPNNGNINVTSSLGNAFLFNLTSFTKADGFWGKLDAGGSLFNPYTKQGNNNAIGNITSIKIVFTGSLTIDYGWNNDGDNVNYLRTNHKLTSNTTFGFAAEMPNYIRINATSETTITSITISYKCVTNTNFNEAFQIYDAASLQNFARLVNAGQTKLNASLTKDIDLSSITSFGGIGTDTIKYSGTFNGNGHKISNLKIKNAAKCTGLFKTIDGAKISDLTLSNVNIDGKIASGASCTGSLVGYSYGGEISNVRVESGTVLGTDITGGIIGYATIGSTTISNCINYASVTGNQFVGGIIGSSETKSFVSISNCENNGSVKGSSLYVGGIIGIMRDTQSTTKSCIDTCKNTGSINGTTRIGGIAGLNRGIVKNCKVSSTSTINGKNPNTYPMLAAAGGYIVGTNDAKNGAIIETELNKLNYSPIWDGTSTNSTLTGEGTSASPYVIEYAEQLAYLSSQVNAKVNQTGKYYTLKTNIDLGSKNWTPIGNFAKDAPFKGKFSGSNLKIENVTVNQSTFDAGLFGYVNDGSISNLNIENVDINNTNTAIDTYTGGVLGRSVRATVENVSLSGSVTSKGGSVGGIVGGNVSATATLNNNITNCINKANISGGSDAVGGILGSTTTNKAVIKNCENYGNVKTTGNYSGGIGGIIRLNTADNKSTVDDCANFGDISASTYAASIVGCSRAIVSNSKVLSTATISSSGLSLAAISAPASGSLSSPSAVAFNDGTNGVINGYSFVNEKGEENTYVAKNLNAAYGRIIKLSDGRYFVSCNVGYSIVSNLSDIKDAALKTYKGDVADYVRDSSGNEVVDADGSKKAMSIQNAEPFEFANGKIAVFYRAILGNYSSIRARISNDNGETFGNPIILLENIASDETNPGGMYEPFPILDSNGNIELFISCDISSSTNGHSKLVTTGGKQNIVRLPLTISNDTFTAGTPEAIINGTTVNPRPGMTSVVKLNDGSYAMAMERSYASSDKKYGFTICLSYSKDLKNWTTPKEIIVPETTNKIVTDSYSCQAPYIGILEDGRIAISYMSNEFYQGDCYRENDTSYRRSEFALSNTKVSYNSNVTMEKQDSNDFFGASNLASRYSGLYVEGNDVYTLIRRYKVGIAETDGSSKATYSDTRTFINKYPF